MPSQQPSVVRQLGLIVLLFAVITGCIFLVFHVQIGVLWAVRAYVAGEGLWSKGQKDAVHHLVRYATTRDPHDYGAFERAVAVPLGDRVARLELERPAPDFDRVRDAFIAARNHPDDAGGMATLFRRFRRFPEMAQAIRYWAQGDRSIAKLVRYGGALRAEVESPAPDARRIQALLTKIDRVNTWVTPRADAFSRTLGDGARRVRRLSVVMTVVATAFLLTFGAFVSWLILRAANRADAERTELLAREQAARAEAERSNRTKDEFVAILSHELRTPLTAMLVWAELLRGGKLDPEAQARALDAIERNTRLQSTLIDDLLDVSRTMAGKIQLDLVPTDPAAAVAGAVDAARRGAEAKGLTLHLTIAPDVGIVLADRNRFQQTISNLLSNAIKFTPSGGRIEVGIRREHGDAHIWVRDTGVGIHPDFLPHVFERFRQADSSHARRHEGLGLGLAIVRHLVELHGGTVAAESPGTDQGATFHIRLPLRHGAVAAGSEGVPASGRRPRPLDGIDVLVVDDDAETRSAVRAVLEQSGACVRLAASARAALVALDEATPDVLLCDIAMPGETGYDLIEKVRARGADRGGDVAAAALTALARVEDAQRAAAAGFHAHLAKPIKPDDLTAAVAELASRQPRRC